MSETLAIGVDLVPVDDVRASIDRYGDRYVRRVFTEAEAVYCRESPWAAAERFAARFAAKEAVMKALRIGREDGVAWRSIEVCRSPAGWSEIVLHDAARTLAQRAGVVEMSLSMSHEREYAVATVIARCVPAPSAT